MQDYHGCFFSISGVIMFGILQGVCAVLADTNTVMVLKGGSSLNLTLTYPKNSVSFVNWNFNGKKFADYSPSRNYTLRASQFSGRLKGIHDIIGVTLQDLQPQDSGTFSIVAVGPQQQYPTQDFKVYIQNPITAVKIKMTQVWRVSTNSCDVDVKCAALGAESVSYMWSGYKTESEAQLQFSLSPAEGAVTLNCTASNNVSSSSATKTLSCSPEQSEPGDTLMIMWIAIAAGVALILLIVLIVALTSWRKSQKDGNADVGGNTVYADVSPGTITQKNKRSDSVANAMTVYETVDDVRIAPEMTIYAKVTLPQNTKDFATSSSPYQQVL